MNKLARPIIGLTVPRRPPTPSGGRPQHYRRPGNPEEQETRIFSNGTTITFGNRDFCPDFDESGPFHEQISLIVKTEDELKKVRQQYGILPYDRSMNIRSQFVPSSHNNHESTWHQAARWNKLVKFPRILENRPLSSSGAPAVESWRSSLNANIVMTTRSDRSLQFNIVDPKPNRPASAGNLFNEYY